jgi:hypothetical protein
MAKKESTLRSILIWTYERGTIQYDIICALILAFIFLVPKGCFVTTRHDPQPAAKALQTPAPDQGRRIPGRPGSSR